MLAPSVLLSRICSRVGADLEASFAMELGRDELCFYDWAAGDLILHDSLDGLVNQDDQQSLWKWICRWKTVVQKITCRLCFNVPAALHNLRALLGTRRCVQASLDQQPFPDWMPVHPFPANLRCPSPYYDFQTTPQPLQNRGYGVNNIYYEGFYSEAWFDSGVHAD